MFLCKLLLICSVLSVCTVEIRLVCQSSDGNSEQLPPQAEPGFSLLCCTTGCDLVLRFEVLKRWGMGRRLSGKFFNFFA